MFSFPTGRPIALYFNRQHLCQLPPQGRGARGIEREADGAVAVLGVDIEGFDTEEMFRDWIAHAGTPRHAFAVDTAFRLLDLFEVTALSTVAVTDDAGRPAWRSAHDAGEPELRRAIARAGKR